MRLPIMAVLAAAILGMGAAKADAALYTQNYGNGVLGPNDDYYTGAINLGYNLNFFGNTYSQFNVNNNGNITFGGPTSSFTPSPLNSQSTLPMIAPFWTDLDSRPYGNVYLNQQPGKNIITWNNMGYYYQNYSGTVNFQLVLNDPNNVPVGEGAIGFFYGNMSAGTDYHNATVGFGDGLGAVNPGEISVAAGPTGTIAAQLDDSFIWFDVNQGGTPIESPVVPEPSTFLLLGAGLAGIAGYRLRQKKEQGIA